MRFTNSLSWSLIHYSSLFKHYLFFFLVALVHSTSILFIRQSERALLVCFLCHVYSTWGFFFESFSFSSRSFLFLRVKFGLFGSFHCVYRFLVREGILFGFLCYRILIQQGKFFGFFRYRILVQKDFSSALFVTAFWFLNEFSSALFGVIFEAFS